MGKLQFVLTFIFSFAATTIVLSGCATNKINLYSNPPQANVYGGSMVDGKRKLLGVTPLAVPAKSLSESLNGTGPVVLEFKKDGYEPREVLLTEVAVSDLVVSAELVPQNGLADQQTINWLIEAMFEVQKLVKQRRYDEAIRRLDEVQRLAPHIAAAHEMKGGVFYIQKKYREALDAYQSAVKLNPKSPEALRMVSLLGGIVREQDRAPGSTEE